MYEYKILQFLFDVSPETCKAVYLDLEYRKNWDNYVKGKVKIWFDALDDVVELQFQVDISLLFCS